MSDDGKKEYPPLSYEEVLVRVQETIDFLRMKQGETVATENDKRYYGRMLRAQIQTKAMLKGYHEMFQSTKNGVPLKDSKEGSQ